MDESRDKIIVKRIVCLANSRKLSGRCLAGKELGASGHPGPWVRPVSDRPSEEVSERERQYEDGSDPTVLDIIDIPLKRPRPKKYQSENWLLDADHYWVRVGHAKWRDLRTMADDPAILWLNSPERRASNDRVAESDANRLDTSLYLLRLEKLKLRVFAPGEAFGDPKRRVQGEFTHRRARYQLWVTDPIVEREYLRKDDGEYEIGECFVTVSLGEPYKGNCYKLIAAVITPDRAER